MNNTQKLKQYHNMLEIYSTAENSLIFAELSALGRAMDMFEEYIEGKIKENYIHLCSVQKLRTLANGIGFGFITDENLRELLLLMNSRRRTGFFIADLEKLLSFMGYSVKISWENSGLFYLVTVESKEQYEKLLCDNNALIVINRFITDCTFLEFYCPNS